MPILDAIAATGFDSELVQLIENAPTPGLGHSPRCAETARLIPEVVAKLGWEGTLAESGLWLLAGELDRSHEISQDHGSAAGSFWHGIMHRREGDFGNSKYWFRRVGSHHVHEEVASTIARQRAKLSNDLPLDQLTDAATLPNALIDACQKAQSSKPEWKDDLEQICWWEWQLLFADCS